MHNNKFEYSYLISSINAIGPNFHAWTSTDMQHRHTAWKNGQLYVATMTMKSKTYFTCRQHHQPPARTDAARAGSWKGRGQSLPFPSLSLSPIGNNSLYFKLVLCRLVKKRNFFMETKDRRLDQCHHFLIREYRTLTGNIAPCSAPISAL